MTKSSMIQSIVIAVDGTAASGKGTLAKRLAAHFGFAHLDSGALYRLTALAVLEAKGDPKNEADAVRGAQTMDLNRGRRSRHPHRHCRHRPPPMSPPFPAVRQALLDFQRDFPDATRPAAAPAR